MSLSLFQQQEKKSPFWHQNTVLEDRVSEAKMNV
jgi:hypothetical protein